LTGLSQLLGAIALIGLGGLFAAIDAAISTVSLARVQELVRDERPGAGALFKVMSERPRYINLVVLLRIVCEISATVLLAQFFYRAVSREWGLFIAAVVMVVISFVVIGVGPAGEKGAAQAAYFGKRVACVERAAEPGGAAVHTGTLPSKTLRETALGLRSAKFETTIIQSTGKI